VRNAGRELADRREPRRGDELPAQIGELAWLARAVRPPAAPQRDRGQDSRARRPGDRGYGGD
jgi:hypothetical protein